MEDIAVTIHRYASSGDEEQDVEKSLFRDRQERPATKEKYKGADLYRWRSGGGQVVCQDGLYVIEITPFREGASPVVMKVLDVVLAQLNSTSPNVK